ncbi:hypothetical protein [Paenarthrobacter sp. A20]|uniref:hypothetical protein n=1 Tax=Paenarthrobacter sp. A20 TaxID=2817891 RepID=UPI00209F20A5|nr:hypothetical protein [Paenarthrobacter sp. A20]MCP1411350.1 hypothetical protein [Paenarthrobacter sp. A20]
MMQNPARHPSPQDAVTVVSWERKPGDNPVIRFVLFSILGMMVALTMMVFMTGLRNVGSVALFTVAFAGILTVPAVAARRTFMRRLTTRINDTIHEVTGSAHEDLSAKQLRHLARSGEALPLLVSGMPGLRLQVQRVLAVGDDAPERWRAVIMAVSPRNGIASFDRLLAATLSGQAQAPTNG